MVQHVLQKPDNVFAPQGGWDNIVIDPAATILTVYSVERSVLVETEHRATHKTVRFDFTNTACVYLFRFFFSFDRCCMCVCFVRFLHVRCRIHRAILRIEMQH